MFCNFHCSYFSSGSLARLFARCGFDVLDVWTEYDGQYLMITARPSDGKEAPSVSGEDDMEMLAKEVALFAENSRKKINEWKKRVRRLEDTDQKTVIWSSRASTKSNASTAVSGPSACWPALR